MIFDPLSSSESLPYTPATSIAPPPQTPPNNNNMHFYHYHELQPEEHDLEHELGLELEPEESPLLNSLQLSPREQSYLEQIISAPPTPQHKISIPAYKFPSLKNHINAPITIQPTRPETPNSSSEFLSRENSIKLNHVPKSQLSRDKTIRYSVHITTDDLEIYKPMRRNNWFKSHSSAHNHGKTYSGFQQPNMGFLKNHKKSKSDY